ncbi:MAG: ABC transporter permease [Anaerolineales bacterium]|jgi:peptide/nickel transport system permease protein
MTTIANIQDHKRKSSSLLSLGLQRLRKNRLAMVGLGGITFLIVLAVLASWISPYSPSTQNYNDILNAPSAKHYFGTDDLGRDTFSRVIWGGRESLGTGFIAVLIGVIGGTALGTIAAFYGGAVDTVISRVAEVFQAFPSILLLLSIVSVLGPGLGTAMFAIGLTWIPGYARLVRGLVLAEKNQDYVIASKLIGARDGRIMFRHILPNLLSQIVVYATVDLGNAIILTAGLSYIGLGAQAPSAEWGAMLGYARSYIYLAPWLSIFPGLAILIAVLSINLLGDGLRDALDPTSR